MYRSHPFVGKHSPLTQPVFQIVFPTSERLHSFHSYCQHATQVLLGLGYAQHCGPRIQPIQKISSAHTVQAELALRYWQEHDNLYIWAPIPIYTNGADFRSLEMALIQEWQPKLNFPFICQFFHPKRGILKKPLLNTNAQFGLATLWRRSRHKFTPQIVRQTSWFQNRLELWTIIHALGSNTKARFEQMKMLRSNDGGLTVCYALRRLANNTQEPFRTLSLNAIDSTIKWWRGKPAPRASALRAPSSLSPNLPFQLKKFLRTWHHKMLEYQVPCHIHLPSRPCLSNMLQFLTNFAITNRPLLTGRHPIHLLAVARTGTNANLQLSTRQTTIGSSPDPFFTLFFHHSIAVIAEGSLSNKVFPSKKKYLIQLRSGLQSWTKRNGLPSMPASSISELGHHLWTEHCQCITHHITKSSITQLQSTFEGAVFHCEDKQASSLRIYCPCLYYQSIESTFQDPSIFEALQIDPTTTVTSLVTSLNQKRGNAYPWAVGARRSSAADDPSSPLWVHRSDPCSTSWPDSSSNSSQSHVPTTLLQEMFTLYCQFWSQRLSMQISSLSIRT